MAKTKVTLSVDEEVLREARSTTVKRKISLSAAFENLLKSFTKRKIEEMATSLGLSTRYVSFEDVARVKKRGGESGKAVRAMRDEREKGIS